jgi:hypothetical protein
LRLWCVFIYGEVLVVVGLWNCGLLRKLPDKEPFI